jgi:hypothetical protein
MFSRLELCWAWQFQLEAGPDRVLAALAGLSASGVCQTSTLRGLPDIHSPGLPEIHSPVGWKPQRQGCPAPAFRRMAGATGLPDIHSPGLPEIHSPVGWKPQRQGCQAPAFRRMAGARVSYDVRVCCWTDDRLFFAVAAARSAAGALRDARIELGRIPFSECGSTSSRSLKERRLARRPCPETSAASNVVQPAPASSLDPLLA